MPVDSYCVGCVYRTRISTGLCCSYSDITGHIRGCKAGTGCTKRKLGSRAKSVHEMTYSERGSLASAKARSAQKTGDSPKSMDKNTEADRNKPDRTEYERLRQRKKAERFREILNGRQRAAIVAYKEANGLSNRGLAAKLGVTESRVAKWVAEYVHADWDVLATVGIKKPEDIE